MNPFSRRAFLKSSLAVTAVTAGHAHTSATVQGQGRIGTAPRSRIALTVNGERRTVTVEDRWTLAELLRDHLDLTGTKIGCDRGECGACTVIHDGKQIRSCLMFAVQAQDADVWTIEGLSHPPEDQRASDLPLPKLPELASAFKRNHGLQCGFCTPGMLIAGAALGHAASGGLDDGEIREGLSGNICRCTGYRGIVQSIAETFGIEKSDAETEAAS